MRTPIYAALAMFAAAPTNAADLIIGHSGRLLDQNDAAVNATGVAITFAIYDLEAPISTETKLWDETYTVPVFAGVYAVSLGSALENKKPLPSSVFAGGAERYLEITVDGQKLLPRLLIGRVPSAGVASDLDCEGCIAESELGFVIDDVIEDKEVKTSMLDDGAVTAAKLAAGAVTREKILDGEVVDAKVAGVSAAKLIGPVADAQIAGLSASKLTGLITDAQIEKLSSTKLDGAILDAQIDSLAGSKVTAPIDAGKLSGSVDLELLPSIPYSKLTGSLTLATTAPSSPATGAIYWDAQERALKIWDGTAWVALRPPVCGDTQANAAYSCKAIRESCAVATSGPFWITAGGTTPFQVYCDMSLHGGGWILVGKIGESVAPGNVNALDADQNTSSLLDGNAPGSTLYAHWDLKRFNAFGSQWTFRSSTDSNNNGAHYQYAFYRPKDGASITPGVAGANWRGTNTRTLLQHLLKSSTTGGNNTTWLPVEDWDISSTTLLVFGYRRGDLSGQCLDGNGQTQVCHCPPGTITNVLTSGTHTCCFGMNDGIAHSHVRRATYWIRDTNLNGTP